jgi:hypothetical protein
VLTASLASWFVERIGEVTEAENTVRAKLDALTTEVRTLRERIDHQHEKRNTC